MGDEEVRRISWPSMVDSLRDSERFTREAGRDFVVALYAALCNLKLYPVENDQVQKALQELAAIARKLHAAEPELEVRMAGEFIFVNGTRLRLGLDNYASFSHVLTTLGQCDIGTILIDEDVDNRELHVFVSLLLSFATREGDSNKLFDLQEKLDQANVAHVHIEASSDSEGESHEQAKEVAKRTYERSVAVTKEVINSVRMGRSASVKKVKRAVQSIVDQILSNEDSLVGLTTIRDYDEYTFTHSVNVCIFSVAIGRRLGLTKLQLYDLGLAATLPRCGEEPCSARSSGQGGATHRRRMADDAGPSVARRADAVRTSRLR